MKIKFEYFVFVILSLYKITNTASLQVEGQRKWEITDKILSNGEDGYVFLGKEVIERGKKPLVDAGKFVAIKVTTLENYTKEIEVRRRKMSSLRVPTLYDYHEVGAFTATAFDTIDTKGRFYFLVFEIVGKTLDQIHKLLNKGFSPRTIARIGKAYILMLVDMHRNLKLCHRDYSKTNLAIGFDKPHEFYTLSFEKVTDSVKFDYNRLIDVTDLVKMLLILSIAPNQTVASSKIFGSEWAELTKTQLEEELKKELFNGVAIELKQLVPFVFVQQSEWFLDYSSIIQYFDNLLDNRKYGSDTKLDWEDLPGLKISFDSLETIKFNNIPNRFVIWILNSLKNVRNRK